MEFKKKPLFLSFEGPEASGKSTQLNKLKKFLYKNKIPFVFTREPGGTLIAEKLRNIILNNKYSITTTEEVLLLMSGRMNHINNVIKPSLENGKMVITDRFADSSFVYQGYVNNFGIKKTITLHKQLLENFLPDKTFLFFMKPTEILKRLKKRTKPNKYDKIDINFHKKVIEGYRKLSKNNKRFVLINAENSFDIVQNKIQKTILKLLK